MSDERRQASAREGDAQVKVNDRRRFTPEGEPVARGAPEDEGASPPDATAEAAAAPAPDAATPTADDRDRRLEETQARVDELSRAYAALLDDNKAYRQRMEREKARVIEAERASVAQALLEAADDLERALAAVSGTAEGEAGPLRGLLDGVRLSLGALHKRIAEIGAVRISVAGQPFDPRLAEAVDTVAVASAEQDGMVLQEVRAGWRIGERVLRPARVRVGRLARA